MADYQFAHFVDLFSALGVVVLFALGYLGGVVA